MAEWRKLAPVSGLVVGIVVFNDGSAYVGLAKEGDLAWYDEEFSSSYWDYRGADLWACQVETPPWWKFWTRTIPAAISLALAKRDQMVHQQEIAQQASRDAKDLADEIAKMYADV